MEPMRIISVPDQSHVKRGFLALHIAGGQVGLPIIVLTFILSKNASRHPTLINFCITWIICSVIYCLLLYSSWDAGRNNSPSRVCLIQAAMVEGGPPMAAVAGLAVVVQLWKTFRPSDPLCLRKIPPSVAMALALAPPYVVFVVFTITTALFEMKYPSAVNFDNGLYCVFAWEPFYSYSGPLFCLATLVLILGLELAVVIDLYRLKKLIRRVFPFAEQNSLPSHCIRVCIFTFYSWFTFIACILFASNSTSPWGYMIEASIPLAIVAIFGTHRDVFLVWCIWRRNPKKINPANELIPEGDVPPTSFNSVGSV